MAAVEATAGGIEGTVRAESLEERGMRSGMGTGAAVRTGAAGADFCGTGAAGIGLFGAAATADLGAVLGDAGVLAGCLADDAPAALFLPATGLAAGAFTAAGAAGFLAATGLADFLAAAFGWGLTVDAAVDRPAADLTLDLTAGVPTALPVDFGAGLAAAFAAGLVAVVDLTLGAGAAALRAGAGAGLALGLEAAFADRAADLPATLRAADFATVGAFAAGFFTFACSLVLLG